MKRPTAGFTLIELMITVAVIAILVAIAYPSYTKYMMRSHRSAAQGYLMDLAQRQQQYLLDSRAYLDTAALIGSPPTFTGAIDPPDKQVALDYTVTVSALNNAGTPPTFTISAAPIAGSMPARYSDGTLTIDNAGNKQPSSKWQ